MVRICMGEVCVRRSSGGCGAPFGQVEIKSVHVVADGMEFGNVERFEIVIRRFDFGAFDDGEADGDENVFDFLEDLANQVMRADGAGDAGEREVDAFASERGLVRRRIRWRCATLRFGIRRGRAVDSERRRRRVSTSGEAGFSQLSVTWVRTPDLRPSQASRKMFPGGFVVNLGGIGVEARAHLGEQRQRPARAA